MKRTSLPCAILVCLGLGACSIRDQEQEAQNEKAAVKAIDDGELVREPPSEKAFRADLLNLYQQAKDQYNIAPNDVARTQIRDQWNKDFCAFIVQRRNFTGWTGRLDRLSQPNVTVIFNINIGDGLKLINAPFTDLSVKSPAYKLISRVSQGSNVTVSGYFAPPLTGECNNPSMALDDDISDTQFNVVLTAFNGAPALPQNETGDE